jgi:hypothetical protein
MGCAKQQIRLLMELPMPNFTRLLLWPPGFLPRRSSAATKVVAGSESVQLTDSPAADSSLEASRGSAGHATGAGEPLGERRSQALRAMFPLLFSKYARHSDLWKAIAIERYLSQAKNITDLEQRIREVQSRNQFRWSE